MNNEHQQEQDRPLWEVMAAAHARAIAGKPNAGATDGYAAELRALATWIEQRQGAYYGHIPVAVRETTNLLRSEADRAEGKP
jgi:hypothetical protein